MADIDSSSTSLAPTPVARPEVVRRLHEATRRAVTLIRAPAGYGKTVLLDQLHATTSRATTALTLSPATSVGDLADAFRSAVHAAKRTPGRSLLVVDRADLAAPPVRRELARLGDLLPDDLRLVLATRHALALPLGRWRAAGRLSEVGPEDLRFGAADTADLLERYGHRSPASVAPELTERAEGWPAGVDLLVRAEVAAGEPGSDAGPTPEQLAEDLLAGLPPELQEFLVTTSVLDRVCADLGRAVTGRTDAGRLLRDIEEQALLVTPLDQDRTWFRYNPLFADLLRRELHRRDAGRAAMVHHRAAEWFEDRRDLRNAVLQWVATGDVDRAFWLVNQNPYNSGWDSTLGVAWDDLFPVAWVAQDPTRMLHFATLLGRSGRLSGALHWLEQARHALADVPADDARHGVRLAVESMWSAVTLHAQDAVDLGRLAIAWPALHPRHDLRDRVRVGVASALIVLDDLDAAEQECAELDSPETSEIMRSVIAPSLRGRVAWRRGDLDLAEQLATRVLATTQALGVPRHPGVRECHFVLGCVLAERGDLAAGAAEVRRAVAIARRLGWPATASTFLVELARIRAAEAGVAAGLEVVRETRASLRGRPIGPEVPVLVDACEAELWIRAGNLDRAGELTAGLLPGINAEIIRLQLALARGDLDAVAAGLTQLSPANPRDRLRHVLLAARLATAADDDDERDRRLAEAAELGIAGGFGRLFTDDAPELLADLDELGVRTLRPPPAENPQLSPRELTVLRYLSGDLTHVDVGNELEVSANTVKSHARAIYRKLGVSSRQEALQVARQLDIL